MKSIEILLDDKIFCPFTGKLIYDSEIGNFNESNAVLQISLVYGFELEDSEDIDEIFMFKKDTIIDMLNLNFVEDRKIVNDLIDKIDNVFPDAVHFTYIGFPGNFIISYNPNF